MNKLLRTVAPVLVTAGIVATYQASAHYDDKEFPQSYRQSYFALLAAHFGPMVAMVKEEMPWDDARMAGYANDLAAVSSLDLMRGFAPGSEKGTTRAKPGIWDNTEDFTSKLEDMRKAAGDLQSVAGGGDREAIAAAVGAAGKTCKACHDEYKSDNYLY